jgi:hypothetical protein
VCASNIVRLDSPAPTEQRTRERERERERERLKEWKAIIREKMSSPDEIKN